MGTEALYVKTGRPLFDVRARAEVPDLFKIGGARRDRTADLNTASVALSQLSYGPVIEPTILVASHRVV